MTLASHRPNVSGAFYGDADHPSPLVPPEQAYDSFVVAKETFGALTDALKVSLDEGGLLGGSLNSLSTSGGTARPRQIFLFYQTYFSTYSSRQCLQETE